MSKITSMLFVALILGLGWAIRGHFGHEWGASWAGGMAGLAVLAVAKRKDWAKRLPVLTALSAIGWAVGGMMSYGIVIGYCRGNDFGNVLYGYMMLAVIGGLYGFIGGGMFGLGLETTEGKKPHWASLITEMAIGAWIVWGLIIYQLEWFMTPPRSELWAACLGAAAALAWYLYREGFYLSLRVAIYAMLGAGFGFSFGNFIHTMGAISGIIYNWWNVMEFTLGFCGGLGLAYAVVTREWPETVKPSKTANWIAVLFVVFAIPLTNLIEAFHVEWMVNLGKSLKMTNPEVFASDQTLLGAVILGIFLIFSIIIWMRAEKGRLDYLNLFIPLSLFAYSMYYTIYGFIVKGFFYRIPNDSDALYIPILLTTFILWFINRKRNVSLSLVDVGEESTKKWLLITGGVILMFIIITLISISTHNGLPGFHERFK
jgi:hypothetical protein